MPGLHRRAPGARGHQHRPRHVLGHVKRRACPGAPAPPKPAPPKDGPPRVRRSSRGPTTGCWSPAAAPSDRAGSRRRRARWARTAALELRSAATWSRSRSPRAPRPAGPRPAVDDDPLEPEADFGHAAGDLTPPRGRRSLPTTRFFGADPRARLVPFGRSSRSRGPMTSPITDGLSARSDTSGPLGGASTGSRQVHEFGLFRGLTARFRGYLLCPHPGKKAARGRVWPAGDACE